MDKVQQQSGLKKLMDTSIFDESLLLRLGILDDYKSLYEELNDRCLEQMEYMIADFGSEEYRIQKKLNNEKEPLIKKEFEPKLIAFVENQWHVFYQEDIPPRKELKRRYRETWRKFYWSGFTDRKRTRIRFSSIPFGIFLNYFRNIMFPGAYMNSMPRIVQERLKEKLRLLQNEKMIKEKLPSLLFLEDITERLITYKLLVNISCNQQQHEVKSAVAKVRYSNWSEICIPVHHCLECKKTFIGIESLKFYQDVFKNENGELNVQVSKDYNIFDDFGKSDLYKCGYNVKAGEMSKKERQLLLKSLFENQKLTDFQIRRDLERNIRAFQKNRAFKSAVRKWNEDLQFFNEYLISQK